MKNNGGEVTTFNYEFDVNRFNKQDHTFYITPCIQYQKETLGPITWRSISFCFLNLAFRLELVSEPD